MNKQERLVSLEISPQKKSFKEIIRSLYYLFVKPENPNNPRFRNLLSGSVYTLRFLSQKIGISEEDVFELFKNAAGCKLTFNESKKLMELEIVDRDQFESYIKGKYREILQVFQRKKEDKPKIFKNILPPNKSSNIEQSSQSLEFIKQGLRLLDSLEIEYLKLLLTHNPSGEFSVSVPKIPPDVFKNRPELRLSKSQRLNLVKKCEYIGLIRTTPKGKCRFTVDLLKLL